MHLNLIEQYNHIYTKYKVRNAPSIYANVKVFVERSKKHDKSDDATTNGSFEYALRMWLNIFML